MMRSTAYDFWGASRRWLAILALGCLVWALPLQVMAQDDGDKKEKKEKPEKAPKEKPEKPEKPAKEKPEKVAKEKPEKPAKEKSAKSDETDDEDGGGEDGKKKRKKKGKKGDEGSADKGDGANTANESFHANDRDSTTKHGRAVPCARYRRGSMEFIDKSDEFISIRRTRRKEIHFNQNRGIRDSKTRKISRDQKQDKLKNQVRLDKEGKLKDKGNRLVYKIKWTGDCEYKLIFVRSKKPTRFQKGWEMDCRITKCYEDYYDCDCDMHDIIQYASIRKRMTKSEAAQKQRDEADAILALEEEARLEEAEKAKIADEEAKKRASEDEIFGPIKRIEQGTINEPTAGQGNPNEGAGAAKGPAKGANPEAKKDPETKPAKEAADGTAKESKPPKEKGDKTPKEKTEKEPKEKGDKTPKEKKEKAPKEAKAPKEKKAKAPKEPKAPKEKKAKAPKEPKAPKEKPEKAPKEPKAPKDDE